MSQSQEPKILGLDLRHAEAAIATLGDLMWSHGEGDLNPDDGWSSLQKAAAALAMEARAPEDEDDES